MSTTNGFAARLPEERRRLAAALSSPGPFLPAKASARVRQAAASTGQAAGANDAINLGFVGVRAEAATFTDTSRSSGVRIAALSTSIRTSSPSGPRCRKAVRREARVYQDQRVLLEART